jgi:hypothetical protein
MNFRNHGHALPDNVVMFPAARRARPQQQSHPDRPAPHRPAAAVSGAELNARLMVLFGICVSSAAGLVSAVHFLQG